MNEKGVRRDPGALKNMGEQQLFIKLLTLTMDVGIGRSIEIIRGLSNAKYLSVMPGASTALDWADRYLPILHSVTSLKSDDMPITGGSLVPKFLEGGNQSMGQSMNSLVNHIKNVSCVYCGEEHTYDNCPSNPESVFYVENQNKSGPYSNTYSQSWRQHPNFFWSNQGATSGNSANAFRPNNPPRFSQQAQQQLSQ
ncbi:hypothetical protein AgCh_028104 [Apium graveolens]